MTPAVAFDTAFSARIEARAADEPLSVDVECDEPTDLHLDRIEAHVRVWLAGAAYGLGGSRRVPPRLRGSVEDPERDIVVRRSGPRPGRISFALPDVRIDPRYATVLVHKLHCLATLFDPIRMVTVCIPADGAALAAGKMRRAAESELPDVAAVPFAYDIDLESGAEGRMVEIEFAARLTGPQADLLRDLLFTWLAQAAQGGYIEPDFPPDGFRIFGGEPEISEEAVQWYLDDFAIDERAVASLVNGIAAFGDRFVPVRFCSVG